MTDADLRRYFKRETLGLGAEKAVRTERPRTGVTITRDRWGVPHVKGRTAEDVAFGAGWATAADRQLIMELLRGPGRIAALDAPGINAFSFALSGQNFRPSPATEARLAQQFDLLRAQGAQGRQATRLIDAYVAGINAQYKRAGLPLTPWTRNDVVAVGGLMGAVFGSGGGQEVRRSQFLAMLQTKLGAEMGRRVWEDLRQRDDPEARVAVPGRFERTVRQVSEVGNVVVDAASFAPAGLSAAETTRLPMSNALLVGARRSTTGKPLFVAGPQVGHFYPGILLELDLDGGGFKTRGAAFPGISFGVLLGRGIDYAWSATSAGSDLVDEYVETLCGGDTGYLHRGECRQMTTFDAGTIVGRPGEPDPTARLPRDNPRAGEGVRDGRRPSASRSLRGARRAGRELGVASLLPRPLDEPHPLGQGLRAGGGGHGAHVQLGLRRQSRHRSVHERPPSGAARDGGSGAADEGYRRVRVAGLRARRRARAGHQSDVRRHPQLEQQAGSRIRRRGRRVDVGARAAGRPPLGRVRSAVRSTRWRRSSA